VVGQVVEIDAPELQYYGGTAATLGTIQTTPCTSTPEYVSEQSGLILPLKICSTL